MQLFYLQLGLLGSGTRIIKVNGLFGGIMRKFKPAMVQIPDDSKDGWVGLSDYEQEMKEKDERIINLLREFDARRFEGGKQIAALIEENHLLKMEDGEERENLLVQATNIGRDALIDLRKKNKQIAALTLDRNTAMSQLEDAEARVRRWTEELKQARAGRWRMNISRYLSGEGIFAIFLVAAILTLAVFCLIGLGALCDGMTTTTVKKILSQWRKP